MTNLISTHPEQFSADPDVYGYAIVLSWETVLRSAFGTTEDTFGMSVPDENSAWNGRVAILRSSLDFAKSPTAADALVLFDGTLEQIASTWYFVDNGGTLGDYSSYGHPVNSLDDWDNIGTGLAPGIKQYYTLFMFDEDGNVVYQPQYMFAATYAFGAYGHARWLSRQIPFANWKYDSAGVFRGFVNTIGGIFDSVKTSADRLEYLWDAERVDADMLQLLASSTEWPLDTLATGRNRRKELLALHDYFDSKGRDDTLEQAITDASGIRPVITDSWRGIIFANSAHSPCVYPVYEETVSILLDDVLTAVTKLGLPHGYLWPDTDISFVGNKIVVYTDSWQMATITAYDPRALSITLDKTLTGFTPSEYGTAPQYPMIQILLGTPVFTTDYSTASFNERYTNSRLLQRTISNTPDADISGYAAVVEQTDTIGDVGHAVQRLLDLTPVLTKSSEHLSLHIKPQCVIERITLTINEGYSKISPVVIE